ncbi:MAG: pseudouridine synthase, partial [Pseudomonadota bacterium]
MTIQPVLANPFSPKPTVLKELYQGPTQRVADYLAQRLGASKISIKKSMGSGALWMRRTTTTQKAKLAQMRRATTEINPNDYFEFYFAPEVQQGQFTLIPQLLHQEKGFSVWYKPAGLVSQGSKLGDHLALVTFVKKHLSLGQCYLPHRLDREVAGVMVVAHHPTIAAQF